HAAKHAFLQRLIADPGLRAVSGVEGRVTCEASVGPENVVGLPPHAFAEPAAVKVSPYGGCGGGVPDAGEAEGAGLAAGAVEDLARADHAATSSLSSPNLTPCFAPKA